VPQDDLWSDLGSSEIRQGMLIKPSDYDLVKVGTYMQTQEHPALYDEGQVLSTGNKQQRTDVLGRFSRSYFDDGLKKLSAIEYIDIRVEAKLREYERKAPRLGYFVMGIKVVMLLCTSASTILGALEIANWIPVAMGTASAFGALAAYLSLEDRMRRVNSALVSIRKLMVWWHGLSVIEKRIPDNKTNLVATMETIVLTEAGCVLVQSGGDSNAAGDDEAEAK